MPRRARRRIARRPPARARIAPWRAPRAHMRRDAGSRSPSRRSRSLRRAPLAASARWRRSRDRRARDWPRAARSRCEERSRSYGGGARAARERRVQRVPRKHGALHALRQPRDTREDTQRGWQIVEHGLSRRHAAELLDQRVRFRARLSLHDAGHHRRRRARDRAATALERRIGDAIAIHAQVEGELVAAKWIHAALLDRRIRHRAVIARPAIVVEDHFLVERRRIGHAATRLPGKCYGVALEPVKRSSVARSSSLRTASTSIVSSTSAANAYVSSFVAASVETPRLLM